MEQQPYSFRKLALWQRAQELTLKIIRITEALPSTHAAGTVARQVVASAGSVAANIAEGHGRYSMAAYRNHLSIARGSTAETDSWLDLLARAGYIEPDIARQLHDECELLLGGLTRQMKALEARLRSQPKALREEEPEYELEGLPE
jgi:four helix bundle protein